MSGRDWRMDAMAEFFNVEFVRIGEDGDPVSNDTQTQDALTERIAELADQFACGAAGEPVVYALHGPMDFAEETIALVTAAAAVEPEPGLDEAIAELRSLVFGKRKKVFALLKMNERHALQGEHRVLWPDAILGLDAKAIADAVRQAKENGDELA